MRIKWWEIKYLNRMKIVIVGGGTAGWLSALYLVSRNIYFDKNSKEKRPELHYDITVVESDTIPIIGAGEGSTGLFADAITLRLEAIPEITEWDFITKTGATTKLGINFKDWNGIGTQFYSPIQPTETVAYSLDIQFCIASFYGKAHQSVLNGYLMEHGYSTYHTDKIKNTFTHSYHFDAHKVGEYFKSVALKYGVKHIIGDVAKLNRESMSGDLESVQLSSGDAVKGYMWFDCC